MASHPELQAGPAVKGQLGRVDHGDAKHLALRVGRGGQHLATRYIGLQGLQRGEGKYDHGEKEHTKEFIWNRIPIAASQIVFFLTMISVVLDRSSRMKGSCLRPEVPAGVAPHFVTAQPQTPGVNACDDDQLYVYNQYAFIFSVLGHSNDNTRDCLYVQRNQYKRRSKDRENYSGKRRANRGEYK